MEINLDKYELTENNFYKTEFNKRQIVIGNSFSEKDNHIKGWKTRMGGGYKKTSTFTIFKNGQIHQHFDPAMYSDFLENKSIDKKIISIVLENNGWLQKDLITDEYFTWVGNIYNKSKDVFEKRWRGFTYWEPYTEKQIKSCAKLVKYLCDKYEIPKNCVGHNTFIDGIEYFEGVTYRSNYHKDSTDLNPSWDFKKFKELIEN